MQRKNERRYAVAFENCPCSENTSATLEQSCTIVPSVLIQLSVIAGAVQLIPEFPAPSDAIEASEDMPAEDIPLCGLRICPGTFCLAVCLVRAIKNEISV